MANPRNATTRRSGQRFYTWGRGERYWSVTTILGALPKDALKFWAAKMVAEFAFDRAATWMTMSRGEAVAWLKAEPLRYTSDRADFGSAVHEAAEAFVLKKPIRGEWGELETRAIGQFRSFVETLDVRYLLVEAGVFSRSQKYAGTLDGVVVIAHEKLVELAGGNAALVPWEPDQEGNVTLLIDYKTGGEWEERKGVYPEVALQLAAYARAEFVGMPNGTEAPLPRVDGAAVIHIRPEGWRLVPVDALREDVFRTFLYVREVFRWLEVISKDVLGTPLELPEREIAEELRSPAQTPPPADTSPAPTSSSSSSSSSSGLAALRAGAGIQTDQHQAEAPRPRRRKKID